MNSEERARASVNRMSDGNPGMKRMIPAAEQMDSVLERKKQRLATFKGKNGRGGQNPQWQEPM